MRAARTLLATLALVIAAAAPTRAEELAVIVHASRTLSLDAAQVAQIYLKQRRRWPDGSAIVPVNREPGSRAREGFSRMVLGRSSQQLALYWNRQYFHGVHPPATFASDEAVKRFVASEPRAIGYVRASAVEPTVRVALLLVLDDSPSPPPRE